MNLLEESVPNTLNNADPDPEIPLTVREGNNIGRKKARKNKVNHRIVYNNKVR